ncbi:hypothetical protein GGX14DRAFT_571573 [Mycena pura]|uniref:Uncharacterized protein n=1 Tax=Mycena pura TaxID=153505 RepID=A0AAD6V293_9AGAR|nr:hypothetical protein GGX14DRAFT_571573 [Mycena pura]
MGVKKRTEKITTPAEPADFTFLLLASNRHVAVGSKSGGRRGICGGRSLLSSARVTATAPAPTPVFATSRARRCRAAEFLAAPRFLLPAEFPLPTSSRTPLTPLTIRHRITGRPPPPALAGRAAITLPEATAPASARVRVLRAHCPGYAVRRMLPMLSGASCVLRVRLSHFLHLPHTRTLLAVCRRSSATRRSRAAAAHAQVACCSPPAASTCRPMHPAHYTLPALPTTARCPLSAPGRATPTARHSPMSWRAVRARLEKAPRPLPAACRTTALCLSRRLLPSLTPSARRTLPDASVRVVHAHASQTRPARVEQRLSLLTAACYLPVAARRSPRSPVPATPHTRRTRTPRTPPAPRAVAKNRCTLHFALHHAACACRPVSRRIASPPPEPVSLTSSATCSAARAPAARFPRTRLPPVARSLSTGRSTCYAFHVHVCTHHRPPTPVALPTAICVTQLHKCRLSCSCVDVI